MNHVNKIFKELHKIPEIGFDLFETSRVVQRELSTLNIPYEIFAKTGIVATLDTGSDKTVLLRADMDALPIVENSGLEYSSTGANMHACGHDAHTAMLLASARDLTTRKHELSCNIIFLFQPAEERLGGAKAMIDDGALDSVLGKFKKIDSALALHVWPEFETGAVGLKEGALTAVGAGFEITITRNGGHVADTPVSENPINKTAQIILGAKNLITSTRRINITDVNFGTGKSNVVSTKCKFSGDIRALSDEELNKIFDELKTLLDEKDTLVTNLSNAYPAMFNDPKLINTLRSQIKTHAEIREIPAPYFIREDFAYYGKTLGIPSALVLIGCSKKDHIGKNVLHTPTFVCDQDTLQIGSRILTDFCLTL